MNEDPRWLRILDTTMTAVFVGALLAAVLVFIMVLVAGVAA